jgi:hypothetical protein
MVLTEGAIVYMCGYEFTAHDIEWTDETDGRTGEKTGRRFVRFTGRCTADKRNDGIRGGGYDGGRYGGANLADYAP